MPLDRGFCKSQCLLARLPFLTRKCHPLANNGTSCPRLGYLDFLLRLFRSSVGALRRLTDLAVFTSLGQPTIQIEIDRTRAARYGLSPGDINTTIKTAIGGDSAGDLYEPGSDRHFPIIVRLAPQYRRSAEAIQNLRIGAQGPNGITQVPLSEVASIKLVSGAAYIYREQQERYLPIKFSVRERDLGSAIQEAQEKVAPRCNCPGLARRVGRRVRQSARRHQAVVDRGTDQPGADSDVDMVQFWIRRGHRSDHERDPDGGVRRHSRTAADRHPAQRLRHNWIHRADAAAVQRTLRKMRSVIRGVAFFISQRCGSI
jgi:hypothetical protein